MPVELTWGEIAARMLLTVLASAALGLDRSVQGHPAGLKTTMLVGLAACLSMVQTNWLLDTIGKAKDSFVTLDLMRLPLGVLTGVGFIGGGAILKQSGDITGLTTAATLWFVTIVGLCFGGGQMGLGLAGTALGIGTLRGLPLLEARIRERRVAHFRLRWRQGAYELADALAAISDDGLEISSFALTRSPDEESAELSCELSQFAIKRELTPPPKIAALARRPGTVSWEWRQ
jgi:putative Mg2+ transporter-C (MgtC) family protein